MVLLNSNLEKKKGKLVNLKNKIKYKAHRDETLLEWFKKTKLLLIDPATVSLLEKEGMMMRMSSTLWSQTIESVAHQQRWWQKGWEESSIALFVKPMLNNDSAKTRLVKEGFIREEMCYSTVKSSLSNKSGLSDGIRMIGQDDVDLSPLLYRSWDAKGTGNLVSDGSKLLSYRLPVVVYTRFANPRVAYMYSILHNIWQAASVTYIYDFIWCFNEDDVAVQLQRHRNYQDLRTKCVA